VSEEAGPDREEPPPADGPTRRRLDPERAAAERRAARHAPPPVIDTRPYQRMIGLFGLLLVVVISITFLTSHSTATVGIPAGQKLPVFAAPLAKSTLHGAANLKPICTEAGHNPGALNVCLLIKRGPLVLAFFVTSSSGCQRAVDALQQVYEKLSPGQLQVAAVAIRTSHVDAARAVRERGWTIPVAYDVDGRVGATYGIGVCPVFELAQRGGLVKRRLIGESWASAATLGPPVRALLAQTGR
jgi:hypothetical protein